MNTYLLGDRTIENINGVHVEFIYRYNSNGRLTWHLKSVFKCEFIIQPEDWIQSSLTIEGASKKILKRIKQFLKNAKTLQKLVDGSSTSVKVQKS